MKMSVFHNISRDAFLGLNTTLGEGGRQPASLADRHPLVKVFEYEVEWPEQAGLPSDYTCRVLLEEAFAIFNGGSGREDPAYFGRRLRSLSVGDVIVFGIEGSRPWTCASIGWEQVSVDSLRVVSGDEAERMIRERYGIARERLSITVPWDDEGAHV